MPACIIGGYVLVGNRTSSSSCCDLVDWTVTFDSQLQIRPSKRNEKWLTALLPHSPAGNQINVCPMLIVFRIGIQAPTNSGYCNKKINNGLESLIPYRDYQWFCDSKPDVFPTVSFIFCCLGVLQSDEIETEYAPDKPTLTFGPATRFSFSY